MFCLMSPVRLSFLSQPVNIYHSQCSKTLNHCMFFQWLSYGMWHSAVWPRCEIKCLCCSLLVRVVKQAMQHSNSGTEVGVVRLCDCPLVDTTGSSALKPLRAFRLCNVFMQVQWTGAKRQRNSNTAALCCYIHHCWNCCVWLEILELAFTVPETSSGFSNDAAVVGM